MKRLGRLWEFLRRHLRIGVIKILVSNASVPVTQEKVGMVDIAQIAVICIRVDIRTKDLVSNVVAVTTLKKVGMVEVVQIVALCIGNPRTKKVADNVDLITTQEKVGLKASAPIAAFCTEYLGMKKVVTNGLPFKRDSLTIPCHE